MQKFTIQCHFQGGVQAPFAVFIGYPQEKNHPLQFQSDWLAKHRGGTIPGNVMDTISKLYELSKKNASSFESLCAYAFNPDQQAGTFDESDAPPPA